MRVQIVTLFPELVDAFAGIGLIAKACGSGILVIETRSPREHASDKHKTVDDTPYGGGSGMVMMPEPVMRAIEALDASAESTGAARGRRILLTPAGKRFVQADAERLAKLPAIVLVCGRYEGIDERVSELCDEQLSLGDFVLNGGELAALAMLEAIARLLPGMLGNEGSLAEESHVAGALEHPQYTRPRIFREREVPEVLLSGNHAAIARYRRGQSLLRTKHMRPDLFDALELNDEDRALLAEAEREQAGKP